jgi:hypothetical protein
MDQTATVVGQLVSALVDWARTLFAKT